MNEIIQKIEHIEEKGKAGYAVVTSKQVIKMMIDDTADCCEAWGYFLSEDNTNDFIGSELLDVTITDTALKTHQLVEHECEDKDLDAGGIMFVNVNTNRGVLQFVAYNAHNGYYGHEAIVVSEQLSHSEYL